MMDTGSSHGGRILFLLICTWTAMAFAENPLSVYQQCVIESSIIPSTETNPLLKAIFEMTWADWSVERIVKCVDGKKETLKNSSDVVEWFVGHTFDPQWTNRTLTDAIGIYPLVNESSCLRNTVVPRQLACLENVTMTLTAKRPAMTTLASICSTDIAQCLNVHAMGPNCSAKDRQVAQVAAVLFYGQCLGRWMASPTPLPATTSAPMYSAIFTCGGQIFPNEPLDMLFPPSEYTIRLISNVTAAAEVHKQSLNTLCSKIQEYASCLQRGLRTPRSALDTLLSHLLDVDHLPATFITYCTKAKLISSEFQCTYESVKSSDNCSGGVLDLILSLSNVMPGRTSTPELCRHMNEAQTCRIDRQLNKCSKEYGAAMGAFYMGLKSETCKAEMNHSPDKGEFLRCSDKYSGKISEEIRRLGSSKNISGAISFVMNHICSVREEWMQCVRYVKKTSSHPMDKFFMAFMIPENMATLFEYTCSKIKDFEKHGFCVAMSIAEMTQSKTNCLMLEGEKISSKMGEIFRNSSSSPDAMTENIPEACASLKSIPSCLKPAFEKCNADLAELFSRLANYALDTCGSSKVMAIQEKNVGQRNLATGAMTVIIMMTSLTVLM